MRDSGFTTFAVSGNGETVAIGSDACGEYYYLRSGQLGYFEHHGLPLLLSSDGNKALTRKTISPTHRGAVFLSKAFLLLISILMAVAAFFRTYRRHLFAKSIFLEVPTIMTPFLLIVVYYLDESIPGIYARQPRSWFPRPIPPFRQRISAP